jgi:small conductance mechanosensitive channel
MKKENLEHILIIAITLVASIILYIILRKLLTIFIKKYATKLNADPTNFSFIKNSVGFLIFVAAAIFIFNEIPYLKSIGAALFAGAGILAVIVGFASQKAFSNIISGIFILIFKPFRIADTIEFEGGKRGVVEEITLRHTIIRDYQNKRIIIPNSIISDETIVNSNINDEKIRKHLIFSISYDSNIDKAIQIIQEEALKHPRCIDNRTYEAIKNNDPIVPVRLVELGDFSINLKAYIWTNGIEDSFLLTCDLLKAVKERFDNEGIEIPFPYRTIVYKKDIKNGQEAD